MFEPRPPSPYDDLFRSLKNNNLYAAAKAITAAWNNRSDQLKL